MVAMTSFHAEKCCHLVSAQAVSARRIWSSVRQFRIVLVCDLGAFSKCLHLLTHLLTHSLIWLRELLSTLGQYCEEFHIFFDRYSSGLIMGNDTVLPSNGSVFFYKVLIENNAYVLRLWLAR